eukprot:193821-Pleurochrysis_carterae.AAC.1
MIIPKASTARKVHLPAADAASLCSPLPASPAPPRARRSRMHAWRLEPYPARAPRGHIERCAVTLYLVS